MPSIPGISSETAVRVFLKLGFVLRRQSKHIVMSKGTLRLVIPRSTSIDPYTMGGIAKTAGLTPERFKKLI